MSSEILETIGKVADSLSPLLPEPIRSPVKIVGLVLRDVAGHEHTVDVATIAKRETAAGQSANNAAHLAGLKEAIRHRLRPARYGMTASDADYATEEVMGEVLKRWPQ